MPTWARKLNDYIESDHIKQLLRTFPSTRLNLLLNFELTFVNVDCHFYRVHPVCHPRSSANVEKHCKTLF